MNLTIFNFDGAAVRMVRDDRGEPWFVAADVCAALDVGNTSMALSRLDDDEKGISSTDTPGGLQRVAIVNESGLYSLILGSRKPEAKRFKRWVTGEVLPSIRKTGAYGAPAVPQTLPEALRLAADLAEGKARAEAALAIAAPKAEFADDVLNTDATMLVRDAAKTLGLRVRKTEQLLRAKGVILPNGAPAAQYVDKGYFKESTHTIETKTRGQLFRHTARVTGRGLAFLRHWSHRDPELFGATAKAMQQ